MLKRGVATLCLLLAVDVTACGETVSTDPNDYVGEYARRRGAPFVSSKKTSKVVGRSGANGTNETGFDRCGD
jgi:hypothetical protein